MSKKERSTPGQTVVSFGPLRGMTPEVREALRGVEINKLGHYHRPDKRREAKFARQRVENVGKRVIFSIDGQRFSGIITKYDDEGTIRKPDRQIEFINDEASVRPAGDFCCVREDIDGVEWMRIEDAPAPADDA